MLQSADSLSPALRFNVTIDTISYNADGAVHLSGRGAAGAALRLYLDNAPLTETTVGQDGSWALTLPEVAPGVYTLRADQVDATGKVTSRFETPFKRETVEALAAVSGLAAPQEEPVSTADATAGTTPPEPTQTVAPSVTAAPAAPVTVTVQPGFTLWRIAQERLGKGVMYVQVFEANKTQIRDPDLIYPGQVFTIPQAD